MTKTPGQLVHHMLRPNDPLVVRHILTWTAEQRPAWLEKSAPDPTPELFGRMPDSIAGVERVRDPECEVDREFETWQRCWPNIEARRSGSDIRIMHCSS